MKKLLTTLLLGFLTSITFANNSTKCPEIRISNDTLYFTWPDEDKPSSKLTSIEIDTFDGNSTKTITVKGTYESKKTNSGKVWVFASYIGGISLSTKTTYTQLRFYNCDDEDDEDDDDEDDEDDDDEDDEDDDDEDDEDDCLKGVCNQKGVLPVSLLYIKYYTTETHINIEWVTSMEHNADVFILEKNYNNTWGESIYIPCTNTNTIQKYQHSFNKENIPFSIKLSQRDYDGTINILGYIHHNNFTINNEPIIINITDLIGRSINQNNHSIILEIYEDKIIKKWMQGQN
jgi:hypothetical protein